MAFSKYFALLCLILSTNFLLPQKSTFSKSNKNLHSLNNLSFDSVIYLNNESKRISKFDRNLSYKYAQQALSIANRTQFLSGTADAYSNIGTLNKLWGNYSKARYYHFKALNLKSILGDKKSIARILNNIALTYSLQNDMIKALEYQTKSLSIAEETKDAEVVCISCVNLGRLYSNQNNHKMALEYFQRALKIDSENKDSMGIAYDLNIMGAEYFILRDFNKARGLEESALKIKLLLNYKDKDLSDMYNNLAEIESETKHLDQALGYYFKSLEINSDIQDLYGLAVCNVNIGKLYLNNHQYNLAEAYLENGLKIVKKIGAEDIQIDAIELLMKLSEAQKSFYKAYGYSKKLRQLREDDLKKNNFEKVNEISIKYETDKKEKSIKILNQEKQIRSREIAFQKTISIYLVGIAILIFFSSVFIYRLYRNKRKHNFLLAEQKEEIEIQKTAITDSINYAYRIQQSILPTEKAFKELLPQSFVFNRPKDIVSGDFYWIYETANQNFSSVNSKILLAMADCTGHGVPGAFMSIIGIQLLNEAINESHSPCSIAQFLDKKIKLDLNKMDLRQSKKDGMEMALCSFDFENNVLRFCGANRPLYRIRKSNLDIFSPQKTAIGFSEEGFKFRNIEIDLQKGDCIYLFSDGFPDQFGGEKDKKLTTKRFRDLLLSIQDEPFQNHGQLLDKFITNWSKNTSQVDDMLVIGVKV